MVVSLPETSEGDGLLPTVVNFAFCFSLVCLVCGSMDSTCLLSSHPPDERRRKDAPERPSNQSDVHSSGGFTLPSVDLFIVLNRVLIRSLNCCRSSQTSLLTTCFVLLTGNFGV